MMSTRCHCVWLFSLTSVLVIVPVAKTGEASADAPPALAEGAANPTDQAAAERALMATVIGLKGFVQAREADSKRWQRARIGMKLPQGAEFRTGPRSQVVFFIPPDQTIAIDRLGTIKVLQATRVKDKIKTDLGMKYGRSVYDVEAAGIEHEATIHMPGYTLSVRGTRAVVFNQQPFAPQTTMLFGTAEHRTNRHRVSIQSRNKRQRTRQTPAPVAVPTQPDPVDDAGSDRMIDLDEQQLVMFTDLWQDLQTVAGIGLSLALPDTTVIGQQLNPGLLAMETNNNTGGSSWGLSESEGELVPTYQSFIAAGLPGFNQPDVPTAFNFSPPRSLGALLVTLGWTTTADLEFGVRIPNGDKYCPNMFGTIIGCTLPADPTRVQISPDDIGGFSGSHLESVEFKIDHENGPYDIEVVHGIGPSTDFTVEANRTQPGGNSKSLGIFTGTVDIFSGPVNMTIQASPPN